MREACGPSAGSSRVANGENSGRQATATLVALRLSALHAFFRRHSRDGHAWLTLDAPISGTNASLADLRSLFYAPSPGVSRESKFVFFRRELGLKTAPKCRYCMIYCSIFIHFCLISNFILSAISRIVGKLKSMAFCRPTHSAIALPVCRVDACSSR